MILTQVYFRGFGPYSEGTELKIDEDVTVLTGANDTGKSITLRLISFLNGKQKSAEDDKNSDRFDDESGVWFTFQVRETDNGDSDLVTHKVELLHDPEDGSLDVNRMFDKLGNEIEDHSVNGPKPKVYWIRVGEAIRSEFQVRQANSTEKLFLQMAFNSVSENTLLSIGTKDFRRINRKLSENLNSIIPPNADLKFHMQPLSDGHPKIAIDLEDKVGSITSIKQRGSGYNRLISYLLLVSTVDLSDGPVILLIDEPETSLHADAQHALRNYLEEKASLPNVQVIYATHSPAMINPSRPESLRLLTRDTADNGLATTKIDNKPYVDGNFQSVRSQLGILAADSLLFAPITVIVEGASDSRGLNALFRRLITEFGKQEYSELNIYHRLTMFFPAGGYGEFYKWLRVAQGNGVLPILLYDGDKESDAQEMDNDHPDVFVLWFDKDTEFEDIVPRTTYFQALAEIVPGNHNITKDEFEKWQSNANLPRQMMFTKRVERWLNDEFGTSLDKPQVMAKAIELVELDKLCMNTIDKLIDEIRKTSKKL